MSDPIDPNPATPDQRPDKSSSQVNARRDVVAGRDIAGRDIVQQTTYIGFNQRTVLSLVIVTGILVFITATCFFSGGIAVGAAAFNALNREVSSSPEAALSMQHKLQAIESLPPNTPFSVSMSETELSSYFRFVVGPQIGIHNGKVRLLQGDNVVVGGEADAIGGRQFMAVFNVQENRLQPLKLDSAAIQLFQVGQTRIGWVVAPAFLIQSFSEQINQYLGGNFVITDIIPETDIEPDLPGRQPAWTVEGITTRQ